MKRLVLIGLIVLFQSVVSEIHDWNLAISTQTKITIYNHVFKATTSAAHQFESISAITYDDASDQIFFSDEDHETGVIFAIKLISNTSYTLTLVVNKTEESRINSLVYDPVDKVLYWTDPDNAAIFKYETQSKSPVITKFLQLEEGVSLTSIAIDICNRNLYWTNKKYRGATVEMTSLKDPVKDRKVIAKDGDLYKPMAITVDHFSNRVYWVNDYESSKYAIETADLDGNNKKELFSGYNLNPLNLVVEKHFVYLYDNSNVYRFEKKSQKMSPVINYYRDMPVGILSKEASSLVTMSNTSAVCQRMLSNVLKNKALQISQTINNTCACLPGSSGRNCKKDLCYNYCFNGNCKLSEEQKPICECNGTYKGVRCEENVCLNYCLNGGTCTLKNNELACECDSGFEGSRCELNQTVKNADTENYNFSRFIENITEIHSAKPLIELPTCELKSRVIMVASMASVTTLLLALLIVVVIHRQCRPIRPRIKKTYVLQKNVSPGNSSYHPTTEQCEITIEDCCNMTVCETPCFDPKSLQEVARDERRKEDKKQLLMNACSNGELF